MNASPTKKHVKVRDYAAILWFVGIVLSAATTIVFSEAANIKKKIVYDILFTTRHYKTTQAQAARVIAVSSRRSLNLSLFQSRRFGNARYSTVYKLEIGRRDLNGDSIKAAFQTWPTWDSCPTNGFSVGDTVHIGSVPPLS